MGIQIQVVPLESVYHLRRMVLRPGRPPEESEWEGDKTAEHWAVLDAEKPVCIASFYERPFMNFKRALQLRGMATHPDHRGRGYGKALVLITIEHYRDEQYDGIWCNARLIAVDFYRKLGFREVGEPFEIKGVGTHYRMVYGLVS